MLLPLHPFLPLSSGGKMLRACVKSCKAYFRRKHDLLIFTLVRTYFNPSGWCSEACIVFEMAYLPPQIRCSVKNYCAVVKLALQNASRLVFRRACFTGCQRQKNTYSANDAFATPALYVFLPVIYPIRNRRMTFVFQGVMSLCASVWCVLCLPIAKHGVGNAIIKGRNTSHSEYIEDWQVSRSRWWGCVQSKPTPRWSVLCFPWLYSLSVVSWENEIMERKAEGSTYPCHDCRTPRTNAAMEKAEKNTPTSMRCCEVNVGGRDSNVECHSSPKEHSKDYLSL